jgi:hypothetical protein
MIREFDKIEFKVISTLITPIDQEEKIGSSSEVKSIELLIDGIKGNRHFGQTRQTRGHRENEVFGIEIARNGEKYEVANWRHWTAVSVDEMRELIISLSLEKLDVDELQLAKFLGANLLIEGIQSFTKLPAGTILSFSSGALLKIESENFPCVNPGLEIQRSFPDFKAQYFPKAAMGLRGVVGSVFREGDIQSGERGLLFLRKG